VLSGEAKAPTAQTEAHLKVLLLESAFRSWTAPEGARREAPVYRIADYDPYTRVLAVAGTSSSCDGSVLIIIDDVNPFTTWAGILGASRPCSA
jgi:hypothetical protein